MFLFSSSIRVSFTHLPFFLICVVFCLGLLYSPVTTAEKQLIDINSASPALLAETLPGIGPAKAKAIVAYRELHGPFKTLDTLTDVHGIGPATLAKIRPFIFVDTVLNGGVGHKSGAGSKLEKSQLEKDQAVRNAVRAAVNIAKRYDTN